MSERLLRLLRSLGSFKGIGPASVRSKFLIMMLLTCLVSLGSITYIAYQTGKDAISDAAINQLTSIRAAKKQQVEYYFRSMRNSFRAIADAPNVVRALEEMASGYRQLGREPLSTERRKQLEDYYTEQYLPELQKNADTLPRVEQLLPTGPEGLQLQSLFIVENDNKPGEKAKLNRHPKDSPYTWSHAMFHRWLADMAQRLSLDDVLLVDDQGEIVYSIAKQVDLGQSVIDGPLASTRLGQLVREVSVARRPGEARFADFEKYRPAFERPMAFIAAPLFKGQTFLGVIVGRIATGDLGNFMNDGGKWREQGLGDTGASYIVGPDMLLRSDYRPLIERPEPLLEQAVRLKLLTPETAQRIRDQKTSVLYFPSRVEAVTKALQGLSGTERIINQRGIGAYFSYAPLDIPDLKWVIVARMDEQEVLASQIAFNRNVMIAACTIAFLATLAAMWLAGLFLRPISALLAGIDRLRKGERGVVVESRSRDEFNDLVVAFNSMSETIKQRDEVIEGKTRAYEQLLKRIFPDAVAQRMRQGEVTIVESFPQVTVIYAIIEGFVEIAEQRKADIAIKILSEIVDRIDGVAEDTGVEKVKTVGDHYLAVSGLSVARLDSARRALEFARLAWKELILVNRAQGLDLGLRIGIATGPVQVGLVGSRRFVFDIWGYAASAARRIVYEAETNCVRLNAAALEQLTDRDGIGDELVVKMKSLGPVTTYQIRLTAPATAMAAE